MPLEPELIEILGLNRAWYKRVYDYYLDWVITSDIAVGFMSIFLYYFLSSIIGSSFQIARDSIQDILNEMISTSLSLGGFVLAALAIIASIQMSVPAKDVKDAKTGKEFFYNSHGYKNVVRTYSVSCFEYLFLFLFFTYSRGVSEAISFNTLVMLLIFGVVIMASSFVRCVVLLWSLIRLK